MLLRFLIYGMLMSATTAVQDGIRRYIIPDTEVALHRMCYDAENHKIELSWMYLVCVMGTLFHKLYGRGRRRETKGDKGRQRATEGDRGRQRATEGDRE